MRFHVIFKKEPMAARHLLPTLASAALSFSVIALAQTGGSQAPQTDPSAVSSSQTKQAARSRERRIYGSHLMTSEERNAYQEKMRAAKTTEEREQLRTEHHKEMQARAKEKGMTLPDEPPPRARQGREMEPATGIGPGGGMGGK